MSFLATFLPFKNLASTLLCSIFTDHTAVNEDILSFGPSSPPAAFSWCPTSHFEKDSDHSYSLSFHLLHDTHDSTDLLFSHLFTLQRVLVYFNIAHIKGIPALIMPFLYLSSSLASLFQFGERHNTQYSRCNRWWIYTVSLWWSVTFLLLT